MTDYEKRMRALLKKHLARIERRGEHIFDDYPRYLKETT